MPWRVEVLNETVAQELDALPRDMKARYLRIVRLIAEMGLEFLGRATCEAPQREIVGDEAQGKGRYLTRFVRDGYRSTGSCGAGVCEEDTADPRQ